MKLVTSLTTILVAAAVSGCQDGTGLAGEFAATGRIQNNTHAPIPAGTRLLVIWDVTSGSPDYGYVFGEGTFNRVTGAFGVRFDGPPPPEALNRGVLGVGWVVATTDQSLKQGDVITGPLTGFIGITAQHAVIFVASHPDTMQLPVWVPEFGAGYGMGVGVKVPGVVFDRFQPTRPSSAVLIVDDPANIEGVNWT